MGLTTFTVFLNFVCDELGIGHNEYVCRIKVDHARSDYEAQVHLSRIEAENTKKVEI